MNTGVGDTTGVAKISLYLLWFTKNLQFKWLTFVKAIVVGDEADGRFLEE